MRAVAWMLGFVIAAGVVYALWRARSQWQERQRAAAQRMTSFVAQMKPAASLPAAPAPGTPPAAPPAQRFPQPAEGGARLLFDAAAKTAQAGEPVLAIQLYARLLSRYPQSPLAAQARAAVSEQKTKLAKA
jgi:TolA-binding protein